MESSESFKAFPARLPRERTSHSTNLFKAVVGIGLLAALVYWGQIDLRALAALAETPTAVLICFLLLFLTLPLAALRWGILLRTFGLPIGFTRLFHFVAIGSLGNLFLLGSVGGDAIRLFYAWRTLGRGAGRIAISLLVDRALGLLALVSIAIVFTLANWRRVQQVPGLTALSWSLAIVFAAALVGTFVLFITPSLARAIQKRLSRVPRLKKRIGQIRDVIRMARNNPLSLVAAFLLALLIQGSTVTAVVVIAQTLRIGSLSAFDYFLAAPITLIANALPLTPNGLGVGELAFDQICRWLEPQYSGAAYSSIFFAFRALGALVSLVGLISFAIYRGPVRPDVTITGR
jgi:uncharacterized protein (TIRG00374 family)